MSLSRAEIESNHFYKIGFLFGRFRNYWKNPFEDKKDQNYRLWHRGFKVGSNESKFDQGEEYTVANINGEEHTCVYQDAAKGDKVVLLHRHYGLSPKDFNEHSKEAHIDEIAEVIGNVVKLKHARTIVGIENALVLKKG